MVTTCRNGQPKGGPEHEQEIPNLEAMVVAAIANLLPGLNADEVINRMIRDYRNGAGSSWGSGGGGQPTTINGCLKSFNKLKPLAFKSTASPQEAEDWITHMEKNFEVLGCGDEFKARLAAFKLEGDALQWWKTHKRVKGVDTYMASCTWTEFRDTFYKRYFPESEQQRFEREYNNIHQRENKNSGEYMQRFMRLASFVGPIAGDAQRQAKHFKWRLKSWVLDRLLNTEFADVSAVNDAARNIEIFHESSGHNKRNRDGDRIYPRTQGSDNRGHYGRSQDSRGPMDRSYDQRGQSSRNYEQRRPDTRGQDQRSVGRSGNDRQGNRNGNNRQWKDQPSKGTQQNRSSGSATQQRPTEVLPPPPLCPTCGRPHPGPCCKLTCQCYRCGSNTHRVKDCPRGNPSAPASTPRLPAPSGRVFTTTA
ncbi:reverse transcriptase domain-containing protein [Artemisia annua]|uniref:Reverse transcriptase domain-containing protein n=1 Tax=Artemisia annua TaxID=35608 RepID=A0A2U1PBK1_ARTAN|nr:reverse transcriptase domain-containing protein [Artemisia annua]